MALPTLESTTDYSIFELHKYHRALHRAPRLLASMQPHGFWPSSAIQCTRGSDGHLIVIRGQHRLHCAEKLGLPIWYIVDDSNTDLFDLEGCREKWSARDLASAWANEGDAACVRPGVPQGKAGAPAHATKRRAIPTAV